MKSTWIITIDSIDDEGNLAPFAECVVGSHKGVKEYLESIMDEDEKTINSKVIKRAFYEEADNLNGRIDFECSYIEYSAIRVKKARFLK